MHLRFIPVLALCFFLYSCAQGDKVGVSRILMGATVNERNEIDKQLDSFTLDQHEFHAHAFMEGLMGSTDVVGAWWFNDGKGENKIYESTVTVTPEFPVAKFVLRNMNDWAKGEYRFAVSVDGDALTDRAFSIGE